MTKPDTKSGPPEYGGATGSALALIREWDNECGMDLLRCGDGIMGYERHMARDLYAAIGKLIAKWDKQNNVISGKE